MQGLEGFGLEGFGLAIALLFFLVAVAVGFAVGFAVLAISALGLLSLLP